MKTSVHAAARKARPDDPQRPAAERFLALGGTLRVDLVSHDIKAAEQLPADKLIVTKLTLTDARLGADDWSRPAELPTLKALDLGGSTNGDVIAKNLTKLTALTTLTLGPGLTDDGLAVVRNLPELTTLYVSAAQITDRGLVHLKEIRGLRTAALLDAVQIGDEGPAQLCEIPVLTKLVLYDSSVTDAGLEHLARVQLQFLHLQGAAITDVGAAKLAGHTSLESLYLPGTPLGDAGLMHLATLPKLTRLDVTNTQVTHAGLKKFLAALGRKITLTPYPKD